MSLPLTDKSFKRLGNSGLKVSSIIVGCMSFGSSNWAPWVIGDEDRALELLKAAYDRGLRTFDTASTYSNGLSEVLLGKFLRKYSIPREKVVIMTKVFFPVAEEGLHGETILGGRSEEEMLEFTNRIGLSRKNIIASVDDCCERLGTYIDLLQIHRLDDECPYEEIMKALHDCVESGKARYLGASSMRAVEFVELQNIAEKYNWTKFISMQSLYNLINREDERELNWYCDKTGVGLIPWSPLARGILARPRSSGDTARSESDLRMMLFDKDHDSTGEIIDRVEKMAKKKGVAMATIATAWVLHKGAMPIVGFSSEKRMDEALAALDVEFDAMDLKYLEDAYEPVKYKM